jgi:alpha-tubulin suppressor-like RCC1 family protein
VNTSKLSSCSGPLRLGRWSRLGLRWALLWLASAACSSSKKAETSPEGEERGHCYANGTCNDGLVCYSGFCVVEATDAAVPVGAPAQSLSAAELVLDAGATTRPRQGSQSADPSQPKPNGTLGSEPAQPATAQPVTAQPVTAQPVTAQPAASLGAPSTLPESGPSSSAAPSTTLTLTPMPSSSAGVDALYPVAVDAGAAFTCAVMNTGQVYCWGDNGSSQSGGTESKVASPKAVSEANGKLLNVVQVALGESFGCALSSAGDVYCWGAGSSGQRGDGTTTSPRSYALQTLALPGKAIKLYAGVAHACALLEDRRVACWGSNSQQQIDESVESRSPTPRLIAGFSNVVDLALGGYHSCALLESGTVTCWGNNERGQLGANSFATVAGRNTVNGLADVVAMAAGAWHTCATLSDGGLRCWGGNDGGQLGNGTKGDSALPVAVAVTAVTQVVAGNAHTCVVHADQTVSCWGAGTKGELGDGRSTSSSEPVVAKVKKAQLLAAGGAHNCALITGGYLECWGHNLQEQAPASVFF